MAEKKRDIEEETLKFQVKFADLWFKWLGWIFALGALQYIDSLNLHWSVTVINVITGLTLVLYFMAFFELLMHRFSYFRTKWHILINVTLSVVACATMIFASFEVSEVISKIERGEITARQNTPE